MAWALRRFPVFPNFGDGKCPVHPIYAEDLGAQAVASGAERGNLFADATGPGTFSFEELLRPLASAVGARVRLVPSLPSLEIALTRLVGLLLRDTVLTRDEVDGLMAGLLATNFPPTGSTRLGDWLSKEGEELGHFYISEIRRNYPG